MLILKKDLSAEIMEGTYSVIFNQSGLGVYVEYSVNPTITNKTTIEMKMPQWSFFVLGSAGGCIASLFAIFFARVFARFLLSEDPIEPERQRLLPS